MYPDGCYLPLFPFTSGVKKRREEDEILCGMCAVCISNISITAVGSEGEGRKQVKSAVLRGGQHVFECQ